MYNPARAYDRFPPLALIMPEPTRPAREGFWRNDADFFDSGTSRKWVGLLSDADLAAYDARMTNLLGEDERQWLEQGSIGSATTR